MVMLNVKKKSKKEKAKTNKLSLLLKAMAGTPAKDITHLEAMAGTPAKDITLLGAVVGTPAKDIVFRSCGRDSCKRYCL